MQVRESFSPLGRAVSTCAFSIFPKSGIVWTSGMPSDDMRRWVRRGIGLGALLACLSPLAMRAQSLSLSSTRVAFGSVSVNTPTTKAITVTSHGNTPVVVTGDSISNSAFSIPALSFPVTVPVGTTGELPITFDPSRAGSYYGTLTIMTKGGAIRIALSGEGIGAPSPALSALGCASGSLTGPGTDVCTVSLTSAAPAGGVAVGLATSSSSVAVPATVTVPAGASSAAFTATVAAVTSATTSTISAAAGSVTKSFSLQLTGGSANLILSTSSLSFGSVALNKPTSLSFTATITGTSPLIISSATVTGSGFSIPAGSYPITMNPGQTVSVPVTFDPTTGGAVSGAMTIRSNASSGSTMVIALSGTGGSSSTAALTLGSSSISFGNVTLNTTSTQSLTLTSSGTAALTISGASVSGSGFTLSGASFPLTLNPGQSAVVEVGFGPTTAGAAAGQIAVTSNASSGSTPTTASIAASGSTATVSLSGTGQSQTYSVDLSWNAASGGSDPNGIAGYNVYRAPSGSSSFEKLTSSADAATSYTDTTVTSGATYNYEVTTVDSQGTESAPSNVFTAAIP
jgi:hypothetical protein